jgi:hypothetical protein
MTVRDFQILLESYSNKRYAYLHTLRMEENHNNYLELEYYRYERVERLIIDFLSMQQPIIKKGWFSNSYYT